MLKWNGCLFFQQFVIFQFLRKLRSCVLLLFRLNNYSCFFFFSQLTLDLYRVSVDTISFVRRFVQSYCFAHLACKHFLFCLSVALVKNIGLFKTMTTEQSWNITCHSLKFVSFGASLVYFVSFRPLLFQSRVFNYHVAMNLFQTLFFQLSFNV